MKYFAVIVFLFCSQTGLTQHCQYKYDNAGRMLQIKCSNQKVVSYTYDKNGNRTSQIISIITLVNDLNDSLLQGNNQVLIFPNPTNGDFKTRVLISEKQKILVQIFTLEGKLIHEYSVDVLKGHYDININITPHPTGTYIIKVKGKTINSSKKVIIIK